MKETYLLAFTTKKKVFSLSTERPNRLMKPKVQKVILFSTSVILASNDVLSKSMTFLIPGVKLVVKTFPSESFSLMEQLKSLEEIWKHSRSERV